MVERTDIERRAQERVGKVLNGKWTLDALLGLGGMAAVYAATHRNNKRAAIKILHPELSTDRLIVQRFLREGYIANAVGHPGALGVNDDDVDETGSPYLVMDLLEGASLDHHHHGAFAVSDVLRLTHQLLDTLVSAHDAGVLHRDLKPANLFLTTAGDLKVLDFGIARLRQADGSGPTQTGDVMGTPSYMSPEQARGRWDDVDARSDLWAVGAVMFVMLSGEQVHEADTATEALVKAVTEPAPVLASKLPDVPPVVGSLVDRALSFDKEERFESAGHMQRAVAAAHEEITGVRLTSSVNVPAPPQDQPSAFAETLATDPDAKPVLSASGATAGGVTTRAAEPGGVHRAWLAIVGVLAVAGLGATLFFAGSDGGATEPAAPSATSTADAAPSVPSSPSAAPAAQRATPSVVPTASASVAPSARPSIALPVGPQPVRPTRPVPEQPPVAAPAPPPPPPGDDPMDRRR